MVASGSTTRTHTRLPTRARRSSPESRCSRVAGSTSTDLYTGRRSPAWRYLTQLPQGRKTARVSELFRVRGGLFRPPGSGSRFSQAETVHQTHRVVRRPHLRVVVAVEVDVLTGSDPAVDPGRPRIERLLGVAAGVELGVTVQPYVAEVRGGLVQHR